MWLNPIFDRTQADVDFAHINRDHPDALKGMRGQSDLDRISNNMRYARELLLANGYYAPEITSRNDWEETGDFARESDIQKFRSDLIELRNAGAYWQDTPYVPELPWLHFEKLNDVERIIYDVPFVLNAIQGTLMRSGSDFTESGSTIYMVETRTISKPNAPEIITQAVPDGVVGDYYSYQLEAESNALAPLAWEILSGWLPAELKLSSNGVISGRPRKVGNYALTAIVENAGGFDTMQYELSIGIHKTYIQSGDMFSHAGDEINIRGELQ
jgi:hypothetical protein